MTDAHGTTVYQYDTASRLTAVFYPDLNPVRYTYDRAGNLTNITYPDQRVMSYTYDSDGRILSASDGTNTTTYEYDPHTGYLASQTLPNGITASYSYDANGRLTDVVHRNPDGGLLLAFHYTLDANGFRTAVTKETSAGSETTSYTYDDFLRLSSVTYPDGRQVGYAYDPLGNRTAMTVTVGAAVTVTNYTYDADNRLRCAGDEVFQYDANGNVIRRASPERTIEYAYDYENRLVRYEDGKHVVEFEYDGDGNRVAKIVDGMRTNYVNDVNGFLTQVLIETDANWQVQQGYTYGLNRIGLDSGQGDWAFYLYDSPLRSVSSLTGSKGTLTVSYAYDAFGAPLEPLAHDANPFLYNGEQYDPETDLIYLRTRYYDPNLGRFLSPDPNSGFQFSSQSLNPYSYVANNPVNFTDPTGLSWYEDIWDVLGESMWTTAEIADTAGTAYFLIAIGTIPASGTVLGVTIPVAFATAGLTAKGASLVLKAGTILHSGVQILRGKPTFIPIEIQICEFTLEYSAGKIFKGPGTGGVGRPPTTYKNVPVFWKKEALKDAVGTGSGTVCQAIFSKIRDLGGVSLNKTAQLMLEIDDITGATYDPATGQIILFGEEDVALPEMDLDDLAVAVYSVYGGEDPGVSIDPPIVDGQLSVRYEGQTRETEFGWVMFEADRVMKSLALGKDNITGEPVTSNVPGYMSMLDRELASGDCEPGASWSDRFWFQPREVRLVRSSDGNTMVFDSATMEVLTEYTFEGGEPGAESNPEAEAFAAHLTEHYDEFAEEWPVLKDLKRLGKVVAIIKWIKDNGIPVDLSFIENYDIEYFSTPDNTPAITVEGDNGTCHITIEGGVSFHPPNEYLADDPTDPVTDPMRDAALSQRPAETDFLWEFQPPAQASATGLMSTQEEPLTAVAQSFTRSRKDGNISFSEVDLSYPISGTFTLNLTRYYDSFSEKASAFGYGWHELPFQLRFPVAKRRFTFGPDDTPIDLYTRIWVAERPAGREDAYELLGIDENDIPVHKRPGSEDILRALSDDSFLLTKVQGTSITFDSAGRVTSMIDPNGNLLAYIYDGSGHLTRVQGSGGRAIDAGYNAEGCISQASGPGGRLITYGYDDDGNLHTVTNTVGQTQTYTYDADHRLLSVTDAEGNLVFSTSYDDYNRTTYRRAGTAADFAYEFDLAQRQTQTTDPYDQQTHQRFDEKYRLSEYIDPLGNKLGIAYDGDFGPKVITDAHGVMTQLAYDERGNLITILDGAGGQTDLFYDGYNRLIATRDPEGIETAFGYDAKHNLTTIYHDVLLVLDDYGNLVSFYYDPNNITTFTYGATGSLDAVTDPLGHESQFAYDVNGQLVIGSTPTGLETTFDYDARSRLSTIQSGGSQVGFSYDDADNLTGIAADAGNVSFGYDAVGNLTGLADAEGHSTGFVYDADGNLATVQDAAGNATTYAYDVLGNLTQVSLPNGTSTVYEYDELGRLAIAYTGEAVACYDFYSPEGVGIEDIMLVASRWRTSCAKPDPDNNSNTPNYEGCFDVDKDCKMNIVDIMKVVAHWGETCE